MMVKQIPIQVISVVRPWFPLCLALCAFCTTPAPASAQGLSPSFGESVATVRLIASVDRTGGQFHLAVAIVMKPGSHTYWKDPGDAGVPPVFAFNGSRNVSAAQVLFPAPSRIKEEGLEAYGYTDRVTFPVLVKPADGTAPASLHVDIAYAVCDRICVPATAKADLPLPAPDAAQDTAAVAAAFAEVPVPLPADHQGDLTVAAVSGGAKPTWSVIWSGATPLEDVFAEAPEGFAFETRKAETAGHWTLVAAQVAAAPGQRDVPVILTLAAHPRSFVTTRTLDLSKPASATAP